MNNTISVPNFKLFFGKYKGSLLSSTPKSYQKWLVQSDFFKSLQIKYPIKVRKGNSEGTWYEVDILHIDISEKPNEACHQDNDPEKKHWEGYTTWLERNSY